MSLVEKITDGTTREDELIALNKMFNDEYVEEGVEISKKTLNLIALLISHRGIIAKPTHLLQFKYEFDRNISKDHRREIYKIFLRLFDDNIVECTIDDEDIDNTVIIDWIRTTNTHAFLCKTDLKDEYVRERMIRHVAELVSRVEQQLELKDGDFNAMVSVENISCLNEFVWLQE